MEKNKELAIKLITDKINNKTYYTFEEISLQTGYHVKYLFKLQKEIKKGTIKLIHGNQNKKPYNAISEEEREKIRYLYSKSSASIRKFARFYSKRSYSCIYNIVHDIKRKNG